MDASVAETVAKSTRERAANDARADLHELRRQAVNAGRERSRKITKTSRIDPRTGEIRYNPAGRLMRDWYLHVYINDLRVRLGEPAVAIDAQQVEDTTSTLRALRPSARGRHALQAVALLRDTAITDSATAAANTVEKLQDVGTRRAIHHAPDDRFDRDELRIYVTRHWYLRCYQDQVERLTNSQLPLTSVTDAETAQVAAVLHTRMPIRLIGEDGIPLLTAQATVMTEVDVKLAAGGTHLVSSLSSPLNDRDPLESLGSRLPREWNHLDHSAREHWLERAGAQGGDASRAWSHLAEATQNAIIRMYLRAEGPKQNEQPFIGTVIGEPPAQAARAMFAHGVTLVGVSGQAGHSQFFWPDEPDRVQFVTPSAVAPEQASAASASRGTN